MKRVVFLTVAVCMLFLGVSVFGQDFTSLGNDFSSLLEQFGKELAPSIFQSSVSGSGMGEAELGNFPHFYFSSTVGVVFSHGIGNLLNNSNYELLNVSGLVDTALGGNSSFQGVLDTIKTMLPYPSARIAVGIGMASGWELQVLFAIFPQFVTATISGIAGLEENTVTFNSLNTGLRIRKVLISDTGGFPAVSLGLGYTFSNLNIGYSIPAIEQSGGSFNLSLSSSTLSIAETVNSVGINLAISKRLSVFIPFFGVDAWYQFNNYSANITGLKATIDVSGTEKTYDFSPSANYQIIDLSVLTSAGLEIKLGGFAITTVAIFSPSTLTLSVGTGVRMQF